MGGLILVTAAAQLRRWRQEELPDRHLPLCPAFQNFCLGFRSLQSSFRMLLFTVALTVLARQSSCDVREQLSSPHKLYQQFPSGIILLQPFVPCPSGRAWELLPLSSSTSFKWDEDMWAPRSQGDLCWALLPCCSSSVSAQSSDAFPFPSPCSFAIPAFVLVTTTHRPGTGMDWDERTMSGSDCSSTNLFWFKKRSIVGSGCVNSPVIMEESFLNSSIVPALWIFALVFAAEGFWSILHVSARLCVLILLCQCIWNHCFNHFICRKWGDLTNFAETAGVSHKLSSGVFFSTLCKVLVRPANNPEAKWVREMQITQHYLVLGRAWILPNLCTRLGHPILPKLSVLDSF